MYDFKSRFNEGLYNEGNVYRLKKVIEKLEKGELVTVVGLGGSITEGAWASKNEFKYFNRFCDFLREHYGNNLVRSYDVGIGSTTSLFGLMRLKEDVLDYKPDLVTLDYTVNDDPNDETMPAVYEEVIRTILSEPYAPAMIVMHFTRNTGENCAAIHGPIAKHYGLPVLSYRDAYFPLVEKGIIKWEDISPDTIHPSDVGHGAAATLLTEFIKKVEKGEIGDNSEYKLPEKYLHGPIYKNPRMVKPAYLNKEVLTDADKENFKLVLSPHHRNLLALNPVKPGKKLELKVTAANIGIGYLKWADGTMGIAKFTIDGVEHTVNGSFIASWEGYLDVMFLERNLELKEHTVTVELLDEKPEGSTGERFMLCYLLLAD